MTLNLKIDPALEQRLREQAARQGVAPDSYAVAAIEERLKEDSRPAPQLSHQESELLAKINTGLPEAAWERFDQLVARRRRESLTPPEHEELMRITNTIEEDHARRIGFVAKLAKIRNTPLESLMAELGIGPRSRGSD